MNCYFKKNLASIYLMLFLIGQSIACCGQKNGRPLQKELYKKQSQLTANLNRTIPQLLDSANIPGFSLAVIADGKVIYSQAYGVKHAQTKAPLQLNTVFEAASLSKPVFAYACLKFVEEGLLNLDKPLYQYLPYEDIQRDNRYKRITARMILSHSSGFPNWRNNDSLRINFEPGHKFSYSGEGYVYLQKVIEKISGQPLNEIITQKVLYPLGMVNSSFVWKKAFDSDYASPHDMFGNPMAKDKYAQANAASSLYTTAQDYTKFIAALLNEVGLTKQSIETMLASQIQVPENRSEPSSPLSTSVSWGLGVGLQETSEGKAFWHWGDNYNYRCYVVAYQKEKLGVVYFTNSYNGLSIAKEVVQRTIGGEQPAIDFIEYQAYKAPSSLFTANISTKGVQKAIEPFLNANGKSTIKESEMHVIGHQLIGIGKVKQAKEVFKLNMEAYPHSANVYEGYAFACLVNGELSLAAENYSKAIKLNPQNKEAKSIHEGIVSSQLLKGNTEFRLKGYADAKLVALAGTFNDWFPFVTFFIRQGDEWVCKIDLKPGKYQYKIVVDGKWMLDPASNQTAQENGYTNSLLVIK